MTPPHDGAGLATRISDLDWLKPSDAIVVAEVALSFNAGGALQAVASACNSLRAHVRTTYDAGLPVRPPPHHGQAPRLMRAIWDP